jgi:hypothetical protein
MIGYYIRGQALKPFPVCVSFQQISEVSLALRGSRRLNMIGR